MSLRASQLRTMRVGALPIRQYRCLYTTRQASLNLYRTSGHASPKQQQARTLATQPEQVRSVNDSIAATARKQVKQEQDARNRRQRKILGIVGVVGLVYGIITIVRTVGPRQTHADASSNNDQARAQQDAARQVVVLKPGQAAVPEGNDDIVQTGHSVVPTFPRTIEFPSSTGVTEYQLMGVGIRTVSFLGISVYVGGIYVATDDTDKLEQALVRKINPMATALVAGEKDQLKKLLLDPVDGEQTWDELLKTAGVRSVIRIVPVRDTDFHHLRDGWVRGITARATQKKQEYGDESFGTSLNDFKAVFNRGSVKKQRILAFDRDSQGALTIWFDDGKAGLKDIGKVADERVSRAIWLNYLAGKTVASEGLRKSVIDGVMEFVERPVGTVGTQVHV